MNENQKKDKIRQLEFEIEQLKRRRIECGSDTSCVDKVEDMITDKEIEISLLNTDPSVDESIDSDNNHYRDRQNRFTFDKEAVD